MEVENKLYFFVTHENCESLIELFDHDTVDTLKSEIHQQFDIPPHNQLIRGWKNTPECDSTVLKVCSDSDLNSINCLQVTNLEKQINQSDTSSLDDQVSAEMELNAAVNFIDKVSKKYKIDSAIFHMCRLKDAISEACLAPLHKRKILLLYLHKSGDKFSCIFMENLRKPEVAAVLKRNFFILAWDIEDPIYKNVAKEALKGCSDLSNIADVINFDNSTALCIVPIKDSVTVLSCLKGNISDKDFMSSLSNAEKFVEIENQQEKDLDELEKKTGNENDFNSVKYQQLMADMLGDRDYDAFEFNQHDLLKNKIAYALFGPPQMETGDGYDKKNMEKAEQLFKIILENSNEVAQYKDHVEISFVYNCVEPLPSEKLKRAEKYSNYNPNTDLMPVPIFIVRKCQESQNPCRIFIDHVGRVYKTWDEYKDRNKLHECVMVLPLNGRYKVDQNGNVLLERHLSPACRIGTKILQGADSASVATGLVSGGICAAAAIPAVTVAPVAVVVGTIGFIGTGIYSVLRSGYTLYDRSKHRETLSFADSEARGAYLNIVAGALGFVGVGATAAVTRLTARGVNIGKGARAVVDAISLANVGASGAAVLNSGYDVFGRWIYEKQSPSLLTVVQLTSSILFFGNAVYNFKTCSTVIEETQVRTLQTYQESLRSNRHRKTFTKLLKETIRQNNFNEAQGRAEVIAAVRNIQNKDEVFAVLTRSNKVMNEKGIKISAVGGDILLNGIKIDFNEFAAMSKREATSFLSNLPVTEPTPVERASTKIIVTDVMKGYSLTDINSVANVAARLLNFCSGDVKAKVIGVLARLLASLAEPYLRALNEIFPRRTHLGSLLKMVTEFFAEGAEKLEEQYQEWIKTGDECYYCPVFDHVDVEKARRKLKFFEKAVIWYYRLMCGTEETMKELLTYFYNWLAIKMHDYVKAKEDDKAKIEHSASNYSRKFHCNNCKGFYYDSVH